MANRVCGRVRSLRASFKRRVRKTSEFWNNCLQEIADRFLSLSIVGNASPVVLVWTAELVAAKQAEELGIRTCIQRVFGGCLFSEHVAEPDIRHGFQSEFGECLASERTAELDILL